MPRLLESVYLVQAPFVFAFSMSLLDKSKGYVIFGGKGSA